MERFAFSLLQSLFCLPHLDFGEFTREEIEQLVNSEENQHVQVKVQIEEIAKARLENGDDEKAFPTFENTILALENSGRFLDRVSKVFHNLISSHTNDELQRIDLEMAPKLALHFKKISLNRLLYDRILNVKQLLQNKLRDVSVELRLCEKLLADMVQSGVLLTNDQKTRMEQICERQASLETQFSQNVLSAESEYQLVLDKSDLAGLPQSLVDSASLKAKEFFKPGQYVFTISRSSVEPFLCFSERADLRKKIYDAWVTRGSGQSGDKYDNRPIIAELIALRMEEARLLGFDSYAKLKMQNTMARTPENVLKLLNQVWEAAKGKVEREKKMLEEEAIKISKSALPIEPSDWRYYAEKSRVSKFSFDPVLLRPYFLLENMVQAAFYTAKQLFAVDFVESKELIDVYQEDVKVYEVRRNNEAKDLIGIFLHDNFARSNKRSGAWMSEYRSQEHGVLPIVVNNNNFNKGEPNTLLDMDDVKTLFHEFGHGLHGLLSQSKYVTLAGTSVLKDFLEFPSQMMEHFAVAPEVLKIFARHAVTNEAIPDEMLNAYLRARNFDQGFATTEYLGSAFFDMQIHSLPDSENTRALLSDVVSYEKSVMESIGMPRAIGSRHRAVHFQHLFSDSSYAAGYYVYIYANVLDCDGFEAFTETGDIFNPTLAAKLKKIYESGNQMHPLDLFRFFRNRDPQVGALLRNRELMETSASL